jgi:hypothetical protein
MSIIKKQSEFTGSDVYVALKVPAVAFAKGNRKSKGKGGLNCYSF